MSWVAAMEILLLARAAERFGFWNLSTSGQPFSGRIVQLPRNAIWGLTETVY